MNTLLFTKPLLSYSFSADLPQRSCSDIQSRKSIRTFDLYEKTCNQVDHLFLGDHFFIWEIVKTVCGYEMLLINYIILFIHAALKSIRS